MDVGVPSSFGKLLIYGAKQTVTLDHEDGIAPPRCNRLRNARQSDK